MIRNNNKNRKQLHDTPLNDTPRHGTPLNDTPLNNTPRHDTPGHLTGKPTTPRVFTSYSPVIIDNDVCKVPTYPKALKHGDQKAWIKNNLSHSCKHSDNESSGSFGLVSEPKKHVLNTSGTNQPKCLEEEFNKDKTNLKYMDTIYGTDWSNECELDLSEMKLLFMTPEDSTAELDEQGAYGSRYPKEKSSSACTSQVDDIILATLDESSSLNKICNRSRLPEWSDNCDCSDTCVTPCNTLDRDPLSDALVSDMPENSDPDVCSKHSLASGDHFINSFCFADGINADLSENVDNSVHDIVSVYSTDGTHDDNSVHDKASVHDAVTDGTMDASNCVRDKPSSDKTNTNLHDIADHNVLGITSVETPDTTNPDLSLDKANDALHDNDSVLHLQGKSSLPYQGSKGSPLNISKIAVRKLDRPMSMMEMLNKVSEVNVEHQLHEELPSDSITQQHDELASGSRYHEELPTDSITPQHDELSSDSRYHEELPSGSTTQNHGECKSDSITQHHEELPSDSANQNHDGLASGSITQHYNELSTESTNQHHGESPLPSNCTTNRETIPLSGQSHYGDHSIQEEGNVQSVPNQSESVEKELSKEQDQHFIEKEFAKEHDQNVLNFKEDRELSINKYTRSREEENDKSIKKTEIELNDLEKTKVYVFPCSEMARRELQKWKSKCQFSDSLGDIPLTARKSGEKNMFNAVVTSNQSLSKPYQNINSILIDGHVFDDRVQSPKTFLAQYFNKSCNKAISSKSSGEQFQSNATVKTSNHDATIETSNHAPSVRDTPEYISFTDGQSSKSSGGQLQNDPFIETSNHAPSSSDKTLACKLLREKFQTVPSVETSKHIPTAPDNSESISYINFGDDQSTYSSLTTNSTSQLLKSKSSNKCLNEKRIHWKGRLPEMKHNVGTGSESTLCPVPEIKCDQTEQSANPYLKLLTTKYREKPGLLDSRKCPTSTKLRSHGKVTASLTNQITLHSTGSQRFWPTRDDRQIANILRQRSTTVPQTGWTHHHHPRQEHSFRPTVNKESVECMSEHKLATSTRLQQAMAAQWKLQRSVSFGILNKPKLTSRPQRDFLPNSGVNTLRYRHIVGKLRKNEAQLMSKWSQMMGDNDQSNTWAKNLTLAGRMKPLCRSDLHNVLERTTSLPSHVRKQRSPIITRQTQSLLFQ